MSQCQCKGRPRRRRGRHVGACYTWPGYAPVGETATHLESWAVKKGQLALEDAMMADEVAGALSSDDAAAKKAMGLIVGIILLAILKG